MSLADIVSTLAVADAIHDFDRAAKSLMWLIQEEATDNKFTNIGVTSADAIFRKLGGTATTPIGILCDASFCSNFVKHLMTNKVGKVYIIKNREGDNDQGTNPSFKGHSVQYANDMHHRDIIYPTFSNNNETANKFGSHFELRLSNEKLLIYIDGIEYDSFDFLQNARGEVLNNINTFYYMLSDILENQDIATIWDAQIKFIQKRSGDFLQVLSCADKERRYKIDGSDKTLEDMIVYFCSSDRIPCAYSLAVGVNTIYISGSGNKIFRNMDTQTTTQKEFQQLIDNADDTILKLDWSITSYKDLVSKLIKKIEEINTATTIDDIKKYLSYAYHYDCILGNYCRISNIEDELRTFMANMKDPYFNDVSNKRTIIFHTKNYNFVHKLYASFSIDALIYDKIFRDFDPFVFKRIYQDYELPKNLRNRSPEEKYINPYGALYGIAVVSGLFSEPTLKDFVITCVQKIIELARLAGKEESAKFYRFFLERHASHHSSSGGGYTETEKLTKADYFEMAEECMDFISDHTNPETVHMELLHMKRLHIRQNYRVGVPMYNFAHEILEYVSLDLDVELPRYLDNLERMSIRVLTETQQLILKKYGRSFLKSAKLNRTLRVMKVRARKRTRRYMRK